MTSNQIRDTEMTVLGIIQADQPVFAKDTPLSLAKEVQGLRAVFDEVSPILMFHTNQFCFSVVKPPVEHCHEYLQL